MGSEEDESFIDQMFGLSTPVKKHTNTFEIQTPVSLRSQGPQVILTRPKSLKSETWELPVVSAPPSTPSPKRKRPRTQQKKRQLSARDPKPNGPLDYMAILNAEAIKSMAEAFTEGYLAGHGVDTVNEGGFHGGGFNDGWDDGGFSGFGGDEDGFFEGNSYDHGPGQDELGADTFELTMSQIQEEQKKLLPEYLEALAFNFMSAHRLSPSCYVLQDWDPKNEQLKDGKYYHVFRMTGETGAIQTTCDCGKGKTLFTSCLHVLVVSDLLFEFPDPLSTGEDPDCAVLFYDPNSIILSVASASGAKRHHSNKRTIVYFTIENSWKCRSCPKERDCRHIKAGLELAQDLDILPEIPENLDEMEATTAIALPVPSDAEKSVSWKTIPPPEWCRLPTDTLRGRPFRSGAYLPSKFQLDTDSRCSCGNAVVSAEIETSDLTIYTSTTALLKSIETTYCTSCRNTKGRIGPDLVEFGVFNLNNVVAFSHELFNRYTSEFTQSPTPMYAFYQSIKDAYISEQSPSPLCSVQLFTRAWFAFVQIQEISSTMECIQCGPSPSIVIADGISVAFPRHRIRNLCPPTSTDRNKALVKIPRTGIKQACFPGSVKIRRSISKALDERIPANGIEIITKLLAEVRTESDHRYTTTLYEALEAYCSLDIPQDVFARFQQLLRQIFSSDSVLQIVTPAAIPLVRRYAEKGIFDPSLEAFVPALGMMIRNLRPLTDEDIVRRLVRILRSLCVVLGETAEIVYSNLVKSRHEFIKPLNYTDADWMRSWQTNGCYYGKPSYRCRPFYDGRDVEKATGNVEYEGTCRKLYTTYGKRTLSGGIMALWCPHLVCLGWHKMPTAEGRNDVFSALFKYWEKAPSVVVYDFACQLQPYCMSREPEFFKDTLFGIDEMHAKGHTHCSQACFISNYMPVRPPLIKLNTSAAECSNSGLNRIRKSVSYMNQRHAIWYTYIYLSVWNRRKELEFRAEVEKQKKLLQNSQK